MNKKSFFYVFITISIISFLSFYIYKNIISSGKKISTLMGDFYVKEKIILDALENEALIRMKSIDQGGPLVYFNKAVPFSRYDHCIGVWGLLRRFNASINEQLTGLWHDISHTAFSHIADFVFQEKEDEHLSYQDTIHLWYLKNSPANDLIKKYNLNINDLDPENGHFNMLEQPLPDMCADRIEYNLHTGFIYNILTKEDINEILNHLHFEKVSYIKNDNIIEEKKWYFDNIISAKKFALLPIYFMKTIWNSPSNVIFYKVFASLLKYSFKNNYFNKELLYFGKDQEIVDLLFKSTNQNIQYMIKKLFMIEKIFTIVENDNYDEKICSKFRGIDPLVKEQNQKIAKRLTEIDFDFNYIYFQTIKETKKILKIKYNDFQLIS